MFEIRVETEFAAAHFLKDYHGKCENLHGHNYTVFAHAKGNKLDEGGMLLDFGELKSALREVCKTLDHTNLNDLQENGVFVFSQNPSAERIAQYIFNKLKEKLPDAPLYAVDVFETSTSRARYTEG
ncbi:MAG: 6-carboxytetrahydropterin synthase QueD [Spirochaetaceae bacterium]|nr:6-carboxytetrahydropterin synthase QueD [Spirochaetaceae bacterium]